MESSEPIRTGRRLYRLVVCKRAFIAEQAMHKSMLEGEIAFVREAWLKDVTGRTNARRSPAGYGAADAVQVLSIESKIHRLSKFLHLRIYLMHNSTPLIVSSRCLILIEIACCALDLAMHTPFHSRYWFHVRIHTGCITLPFPC